jgi:hypothetical protein
MGTFNEDSYGSPFERIFVSLLAVSTGLVLIYLAIKGPLVLGLIKYKTAEVINNQLVGQDVVNLFLLSPILIIGGIALFLKKPVSKYLLIATPLYLIYYVFGYTVGWEWSSPSYSGTSQAFTFHFLFVLITSLIILLYTLAEFPKNAVSRFKKRGLIAYSALFSLFLVIFAGMWVQEIREVIATGTTRAYDIAPTAFWLVRVFDLGFCVPLGLLSVYLLWARPNKAYPIICLFYGFFFTQIVAVNAMGWVMFLKHDPAFLWRDLIVFSILALIIFFGFFFVRRNYKTV